MSGSGPAPPVVCKLGGSVVTEKGRQETLDEAAIDRSVAAIARARTEGALDSLVLVHGGGSFGHHHATDHGVDTRHGTHDGEAVRAIHGAMVRLNEAICSRLTAAGVPVVPVHPLSVAHRGGDGTLDLPTASIELALQEGFVPVTHGDLVVHAGEGATVVSGDELVVSLAESTSASRVGLCSTVPGVLDADERVIERIDDYADVATVLGESDATDVTGGMAAKVRALLDLEAPASVFGPEDLSAFLDGERPGTTVG